MRRLRVASWSRSLAVVTVGVILTITLMPVAGSSVTSNPDVSTGIGTPLVSDMILNVLLFVPFGFFLRGSGVNGWKTALIGLALSVTVEVLQGWLPGRFSTATDVVVNTAGTALGVAAFRYGIPSLLSGTRASRAVAVPWAVGLAGVIAATAWLVVPAPPDTVYYGQWTADLGHLERYRGRVIAARLGGVPVPDGRVGEIATELRRRIQAGEPLEVVLEAGPQVEDLAPIFSIFDEHQREVLLLGVDREDIVFRTASRGGGLGMRDPEHRLEGGAELLTPGSQVRLRVASDSAGVCITADESGRCGIANEAWSGWALLLPADWFPGFASALTGAIWLGLLAAPIGLWGGMSRYTVLGWLIGVFALTVVSGSGLSVPLAAPAVLTGSVLAGAWAGNRLRSVPFRGAEPAPSGPLMAPQGVIERDWISP